MRHKSVQARDKGMSHKGPHWVLDLDNIRKGIQGEVSAGRGQAWEGPQNHTYLPQELQ